MEIIKKKMGSVGLRIFLKISLHCISLLIHPLSGIIISFFLCNKVEVVRMSKFQSLRGEVNTPTPPPSSLDVYGGW